MVEFSFVTRPVQDELHNLALSVFRAQRKPPERKSTDTEAESRTFELIWHDEEDTLNILRIFFNNDGILLFREKDQFFYPYDQKNMEAVVQYLSSIEGTFRTHLAILDFSNLSVFDNFMGQIERIRAIQLASDVHLFIYPYTMPDIIPVGELFSMFQRMTISNERETPLILDRTLEEIRFRQTGPTEVENRFIESCRTYNAATWTPTKEERETTKSALEEAKAGFDSLVEDSTLYHIDPDLMKFYAKATELKQAQVNGELVKAGFRKKKGPSPRLLDIVGSVPESMKADYWNHLQLVPKLMGDDEMGPVLNDAAVYLKGDANELRRYLERSINILGQKFNIVNAISEGYFLALFEDIYPTYDAEEDNFTIGYYEEVNDGRLVNNFPKPDLVKSLINKVQTSLKRVSNENSVDKVTFKIVVEIPLEGNLGEDEDATKDELSKTMGRLLEDVYEFLRTNNLRSDVNSNSFHVFRKPGEGLKTRMFVFCENVHERVTVHFDITPEIYDKFMASGKELLIESDDGYFHQTFLKDDVKVLHKRETKTVRLQKVPKNKVLTIELMDRDGSVIYEHTIGGEGKKKRVEEVAEGMSCFDCGKPATYYQQYDNYYCHTCQKYLK